MGVIKRQGLKNLIVQYFGMILGFASVIFIYPMAKEQYGLYRVLYDASSILSPIVLLGVPMIAIKFFPEFSKKPNLASGFFSFNTLILLFGIVLFIFLFYPIRTHILYPLYEDSDSYELFKQFSIYVIPITIALALLRFITRYTSNFQRITIPVIFDQLFIKIALPIFTILFVKEIFDNTDFVQGVVITFILGAICAVLYLVSLGKVSFNNPFAQPIKARIPAMASYAGYTMLATLGVQVAFRIDSIMVAGFEGFEKAGFYVIIVVITEIISKPGKAIISVAGPIISKHLTNNKIDEVEKLYKSSSLNLLLIGFMILCGILLTISSLFEIMKDTEPSTQGLIITLLLGLAHLTSVGASVNNEIINYSKYFRFTVVAIIFLAILNIGLNLYLIPRYDLIGAALATFISMALSNALKVIFIWVKFKIHPFSKETLGLLLISLTLFYIVWFIPNLSNPFLNIAFKSVIFASVYITTVFKLKLSLDFNDLFLGLIKKIRR